MNTYKYTRLKLRPFILALGLGLAFISCSDDDAETGQPTTPTNPAGTRFMEPVFTNTTVSRDIEYGSNTTQGGIQESLLMDIHVPEGDSATNRPLVVFVHGGGFFGGTKGDDFGASSTFFAQAGYVDADINYRLIDTVGSEEEITEAQLKLAIIQAVHDLRAAIRFFVADAANSNTYRVDPDNVFIGGYSAGAVTVLHAAYLNTIDELSTFNDQNIVDYVNMNGGLQGNSGNDSSTNFTLRGVMNLSGALVSANLINAEEIPVISFHGTADTVVPFGTALAEIGNLVVDGSSIIDSRASDVGVSSTLNPLDGGGHLATIQCNSCVTTDLIAFTFSNLAAQ